MVQIEKDIAAGPQGEDNGDRMKTARAEADAARERAETIQRSRNCEWLRLRWHAVASCALGPPDSFSAVEPSHSRVPGVSRAPCWPLMAGHCGQTWEYCSKRSVFIHLQGHTDAAQGQARASVFSGAFRMLLGATFRKLIISV